MQEAKRAVQCESLYRELHYPQNTHAPKGQTFIVSLALISDGKSCASHMRRNTSFFVWRKFIDETRLPGKGISESLSRLDLLEAITAGDRE